MVAEATANRIRAAHSAAVPAWRSLGHPAHPSDEKAIRLVLAVAGLESGYGVGFGTGVNNWGAIQCSHGPPCGDSCIQWGDTHADGSGYTWCYRRYPTPQDGAADLARLLIKKAGLDVMRAGEPYALARKMYEGKYFEGRDPTPATPLTAEDKEAIVRKYGDGLAARLGDINDVLGAPSTPPDGGVSGWPIIVIAGVALAALLAGKR